MEVEFTIESLSIMIYTNIPEKKNQIVEFTRNMLYIPKPPKDSEFERESVILENLPYFTTDVDYELAYAEMTYLDYYDRVNLFFNGDKFVELLRRHYKKNTDNNHESRIRKNIMTMLEVLFPTKFPVINDIHTSYNFLINKQSSRPFWFNPFKTHYFSYLKIDNKKYTIKKTVWLNDILNHPVYRKMIVEYRKLRKWADEEKANTYNIPNIAGTKSEGLEAKIITGFNEIVTKLVEIQQTHSEYQKNDDETDIVIINNNFADIATNALENKDIDDITKVRFITEILVDYLKEKENNIYDCSDNKGCIIDNKRYKAELLAIATSIGALIQNKEQADADRDDIDNIFKRQFGENENIMVRKFQAIMNEYSEPFRKSSNNNLQNLIDSVNAVKGTKGMDEIATNFYDTMEDIYIKYVKGEDPPGNMPNLLSHMDVGISYINIGDDDTKPTKEVYFMIDLIEGEVNDDNVYSIYCPYTGDYLGNQLEYLIKEVRGSHKNKWAVDKNRQMFSLTKVKSSITNKFSSKELVSNEVTPSSKIGPQQLDANILETDPTQNFKSYIMTSGLVSTIDKKIKDLQNAFIEDKNIMLLNSNNILDTIRNMDSNPIAKELYSTIQLWNTNKNIHNSSVTKKINGIKGNITARNKDIDDELEHPNMVYDSAKQKEKSLKKEKGMNNILETIIDSVLAHENTKPKRINGGTRKKKISKQKQTKRIRRR